MIAICLKFPAGRYHATPWGRHVNEGVVVWPPSPWRILRALIATWKRTLPEISQQQVEPVFRVLAAPPDFVLPPASTGHTQHYMPWFKKGPDDRTLVLDAFIAVSRDAALLVRWPDASLDESQRKILARILANLNTLGRAESWCEARIATEEELGSCRDRPRAMPLNGHDPNPGQEIIRLLCPDRDAAFVNDVEERTAIYDLASSLCMETLQLHRERWSDPPGSRWVQYTRPRDCFEIEAARAAGFNLRERTTANIQVVRYVFDPTVLPLVTETLPVAEAARRALMSIYGRITERSGIRGRSSVFSGKQEDGRPLAGHGHAYYLPTDEDGDGRLDHLTVFARNGFDAAERGALDQLRQIRLRGRDAAAHPLRLLLLGMGVHSEYRPGPLTASRVWVSAAPYIATRHAKTRGRDRIDLHDVQARAKFLMADLRDNIRVVLGHVIGNADGVGIVPLFDGGAFRVDGRWRPIQFKRFRSKAGDDGGRRLAGAFQIRFPQPVPGPIALGYSSHFGMGLFVPEDEE